MDRKYDDNQPRDDNGQWSSGGGSSSDVPKPKGPKRGINGQLNAASIAEFERDRGVRVESATRAELQAAVDKEFESFSDPNSDRGGDADYEFLEDLAHRYGLKKPWEKGQSAKRVGAYFLYR